MNWEGNVKFGIFEIIKYNDFTSSYIIATWALSE
jgi:hypothetical protein